MAAAETQVEEKQSVDYDEILSKVGHFGTFQTMILFLLSCCSAAGGLVVVVFPFTAYQQQYRWEVETSHSTEDMTAHVTFMTETGLLSIGSF